MIRAIERIIRLSEDNQHIPVEWGVTQGNEALRIGWGCPIEPHIQSIANGIGSQLLGYINYFLPLSEMVGITAAWLIAIASYYIASVVKRWIKVIS
jgi:hypothetical protein